MIRLAFTILAGVLLGLIVQKVSGQPYDRFLEARAFRPLGMTATRRDYPGAIVPGRARGAATISKPPSAPHTISWLVKP